MMDVQKLLEEHKVVLMLTPGADYNTTLADVAKQLGKGKMIYVTLNKTADSLKEQFRSNGMNVENILFVDCITKTFKNAPTFRDNIYFVNSPGAIVELRDVINEIITTRKNVDYLIFDSITNVLIYQELNPTIRFVSTVVQQIKETQIKAVFYTLNIDRHQELIQQSYMFMGTVVDLSRWSG